MDPNVQAINQILGGENPSTSDSNVQQINSILQNSQPQPSDPWGEFQQTAQKVVSDRGLPSSVLPVLLGQAAIESARGSAAPGNNYFGIKGQGTAGSNNLATQEYGQGGYYGENSNFAAYKSPEDSVNAYLDLIQSYPGVSQAIQSGNKDAIIRAIESAGYATSPTYVQSVEGTPEFQGK
jgi:flagellum-specific peptidoglycan hydrolase FlgJ